MTIIRVGLTCLMVAVWFVGLALIFHYWDDFEDK
jgi:hypothetical protein